MSLRPTHLLLCDATLGPFQPTLDLQSAATVSGAPLEVHDIFKTVVASSGCPVLQERRSQCRQFSQGCLPLVFCPLCRRCLAACSFLLLVTSECQATLCALLSFLFRFCSHLFALSSVLLHCTQSEARRKAHDLGPFAIYSCLLFSKRKMQLQLRTAMLVTNCKRPKRSSQPDSRRMFPIGAFHQVYQREHLRTSGNPAQHADHSSRFSSRPTCTYKLPRGIYSSPSLFRSCGGTASITAAIDHEGAELGNQHVPGSLRASAYSALSRG